MEPPGAGGRGPGARSVEQNNNTGLRGEVGWPRPRRWQWLRKAQTEAGEAAETARSFFLGGGGADENSPWGQQLDPRVWRGERASEPT